jgi:cation:H+ antiporter
MGLLPQRTTFPVILLFLLFVIPLRDVAPSTVLWAAPAILGSALMITWAAESAQYFVAQGFALAILAWLQTLPEFAVEAVFAWHQQVPLLLAGLTGALRLLTGFGWPVIYFTAAMFHRQNDAGKNGPLRSIRLEEHHAVEVIGLFAALVYVGAIALKGSLNVWDGIVLILIYAAYLIILAKMPSQDVETIEDLERIPRAIVTSPRARRIAAITALFAGGGALIYFSADPFAAGMVAFAVSIGIPAFVCVQWVSPLVSEAPEMLSTFYWARTVEHAPMALMNMVSSNINQWTLLPAMLPILLSFSHGSMTPIVFDPEQNLQLVMTFGQALVGMTFLLNMELAWWEATFLFVLFFAGLNEPWAKPVTVIYFAWAAFEFVRMLFRPGRASAFGLFGKMWSAHVRPRG